MSTFLHLAEHDSVDPAGFAPDIAMHALLCRTLEREGAVGMGYEATGYLRGIATALAVLLGREAARVAIKRMAEEAAGELVGGEKESSK